MQKVQFVIQIEGDTVTFDAKAPNGEKLSRLESVYLLLKVLPSLQRDGMKDENLKFKVAPTNGLISRPY